MLDAVKKRKMSCREITKQFKLGKKTNKTLKSVNGELSTDFFQ